MLESVCELYGNKTGRAKRSIESRESRESFSSDELRERENFLVEGQKILFMYIVQPHPFVCSAHIPGASATLAVPHWLACIRIKMV